MNTHASSGKQWTQVGLDSLNVENGFRQRGVEVTRLDTFIDAAFAFVLTLLVISFDEIPSDYADMLAAAKRIPGFAASFAMLMVFWLEHRRWSRRYGFEDSRTILLSLSLIFVVLVYVYPLRTIFEGLFSSLSDGYFPSSIQLQNYDELRGIFLFYSVGFFAMSLVISQLYRAALKNRDMLALNQVEQKRTKLDMQVWLFASGLAPVSIMLALFLPDEWVPAAGYVYFALFGTSRLPFYLARRRIGRE